MQLPAVLQNIFELQKKSLQFFDQIFAKYKNQMNCGEGCSACCHVDLSVLPSEAALIYFFVNSLERNEQEKLFSYWSEVAALGQNLAGQPTAPCTFLYQNKCTIYPVRPVICRTQGAPLYIRESKSLDVCPLNFINEPRDNLPLGDCLDLERLTAAQVTIDKMFQQSIVEDDSFSQLKAMINQDGRISLIHLRALIIDNLQ